MQAVRCLRASLSSSKGRNITTLLFEAPPLYLCPAVRGFASSSLSIRSSSHSSARKPTCSVRQRPRARYLHAAQATPEPLTDIISTPREPQRTLPAQCTGCGAFAQTAEATLAGYFDLERPDIKKYVGLAPPKAPREPRSEDAIVQQTRQMVDVEKLRALGVDVDTLFAPSDVPTKDELKPVVAPVCDRCHDLVHYSRGEPIHHPSLEALRETIEETPHKYNHVYHVLDAADFPMSLFPRIGELLDLMPLRSKNRRAQQGRFYKDRKMEMSFIITRADLLAPKKEMVDRMMPVLKETLREALGRRGRDVRLGNVRCVSSKRDWWTKELKEEIYKRGGGGWMVGKVNVGKSALFESVFPKGRMEKAKGEAKRAAAKAKGANKKDIIAKARDELADPAEQPLDDAEYAFDPNEEFLDEFSLLPPARPETEYPEMPIVSSLPGTTASPIRVPFGNGKGELIDLPGLERTLLDTHVKPEHRHLLLMKSRMRPEQQVLRPGTSLLLGGFIRLTPRTPDVDFLAYAFTPIKPHVSRTDKAEAIQGQTGEVNVENIALPGTADKIRHAGSFKLKWDVTKLRAGPITRRSAANIPVEDLPYRILSTDILIEGCGWVEVVAQVRTKYLYAPKWESEEQEPRPRLKREKGGMVTDANGVVQSLDLSEPGDDVAKQETGISGDWFDEPDDNDKAPRRESREDEPNWPVIDVYTPEGKFVAARRPFNAYLLNRPLRPDKGRPHKSMKGEKKQRKEMARARAARVSAPATLDL